MKAKEIIESIEMANVVVPGLTTIVNISNSDSQLDSVTNTSDALEHNLNIPSSLLKDSQVERADKIREIKEAYNVALEYYKAGKYEEAEKDFVKVIRPVLAKNEMKHLYVTVEDVKLETLDAMYHIGLIIQNIKGRDGNYRYENNFAKATAIFQYCAEFVKKHKIEHEADFVELAFLTERSLLQDLGTDSQLNITEYLEKIDGYKNKLKLAREAVKVGLDSVKDLTVANISTRAARVEEIYRDSVEVFVSHSPEGNGLLQNLLSDCQSQLPLKPEGLEYAVIGLGSISIGTMTPWSDIEFAILINEASTKNEQEIYREYCRNLTKLLHTKIINLGETALRSVGIEILNNFKTANKSDDWFWDDVMSSGVSFDGAHWHACKTPFGRKGYKVKITNKDEDGTQHTNTEEKPDYELIMTPQEMAKFQDRNGVKSQTLEGRDWFSTDKHLVQALKSVALIDGSQSLLDEYRDLSRANEVDTRERALEILQEDITKFSLKLGNDEEGKLIDVKKAIYRLGDRVVVSLANYYQITAEKGQTHINLWQIIDLMQKNQKLDLQGAINLKQAVSIATELRLSTYLNNQGQSDGMSTYEPAVEHLNEVQRQELREKTFYIKDTAILHHFYYVMLRVQILVQGFCSAEYHNEVELVLNQDDLFDDSNYNKGMVCARFLEYRNAIQRLELAKDETPKNLKLLKNLEALYFKAGMVDNSISIGLEIYQLVERNPLHNLSTNHSDKACSFSILGTSYRKKGLYNKAIEEYLKSVDIFIKFNHGSPIHFDIAVCYNNIGLCYKSNGNFPMALQHYKESLKIHKEIHSKATEILYVHNNLAVVYRLQKKFDMAIKEYTKALEICQTEYIDNPNHVFIGTLYNNLGSALQAQGKNSDAILAFSNAIDIFSVLYKNLPRHNEIASCYCNLAESYRAIGNYDKAISLHTKALNIKLEIYQSNTNHPSIALSYNNLGAVCLSQENYFEALLNFNKAKAIWSSSYPNHVYSSNLLEITQIIPTLLQNLQIALLKGRYIESAEKCFKVLDTLSDKDTESLITCYTYLSSIFEAVCFFEDALQYLSNAIQLSEESQNSQLIFLKVKQQLLESMNSSITINFSNNVLTHLKRKKEEEGYIWKNKSSDVQFMEVLDRGLQEKYPDFLSKPGIVRLKALEFAIQYFFREENPKNFFSIKEVKKGLLCCSTTYTQISISPSIELASFWDSMSEEVSTLGAVEIDTAL